MNKGKILRYVIVATVAVTIYYAWKSLLKKDAAFHPRDYAEIVADSTLRATAEYNSLGLHMEGDSLVGFYYELISTFAADHGLKLDITPEMSFERRLEGLEDGRYDIIAEGIPVTTSGGGEEAGQVIFTSPIMLSHQVLVQRSQGLADSAAFIRSLVDLAGRTLYVIKGSPAVMRIHNVASEIGDTIYIKEVDKYGPEQLISLVAHGDIDYAVCDRRIAELAADSLPQIDIYTPIGFSQFYSWAVNAASPVLADTVNAWIGRFLQTDAYRDLYRKYYLKAFRLPKPLS